VIVVIEINGYILDIPERSTINVLLTVRIQQDLVLIFEQFANVPEEESIVRPKPNDATGIFGVQAGGVYLQSNSARFLVHPEERDNIAVRLESKTPLLFSTCRVELNPNDARFRNRVRPNLVPDSCGQIFEAVES
jgi:hypothetical protein